MRCTCFHWLMAFAAFSWCGPEAAVLQAGSPIGEKATAHRFEKLRAGAIQTAKGWNVQDFASSFFNPNSEEITVTMKLLSDDPKFVFANGQVGTYTKTSCSSQHVHLFRPAKPEQDRSVRQ